jgi:SAM-dependent methyltransferase
MRELGERANNGLHESLLERLPAELEPQSPILDVGCGTGAWLARLHRSGYNNLTGIDRDTAQWSFAGARVATVDLNAPDWDAPEGPFALITAIEVVEHLENLGGFFDQLGARLAAGGSILLTTPNVESLAARLRFLLLCELKQFDSIGDPTHLFPMISATLPRLLQRRGLAILERWSFPSDGTTISSRRWVNRLCALMRPFLPEPIPGDNVCMRIGRADRS